MNVGIIGLGLIGGSMAKSIREENFCQNISGFDVNSTHQEEALRLRLVDKIDSIEGLLSHSDLIILAIPVDASKKLLPVLLESAPEHLTIVDLGSTKKGICDIANQQPNRKLYVAAHPIAGTENTGPSAAISDLFKGKVNIICEAEKSGKKQLETAKSLFDSVGMRTLFMDPEEHDRHIAYVSHLSHISSFVLGNTVLEIEKDEDNIFNMAGSGFASTVRLAKSSPEMWAPIFDQNKEDILSALGAYINNLEEFKNLIKEGNTEKLTELMRKSNEIRRVLNGIEKK